MHDGAKEMPDVQKTSGARKEECTLQHLRCLRRTEPDKTPSRVAADTPMP